MFVLIKTQFEFFKGEPGVIGINQVSFWEFFVNKLYAQSF